MNRFQTLLASSTLLLSGCMTQPVESEEALRFVRGTIGIDGTGQPTVLAGVGWSVTEIQTGRYRIDFNTPFPSGVQNRPSVVVSGNQGATVYTPAVSGTHFEVGILFVSGQPGNQPVHFVAAGPAE